MALMKPATKGKRGPPKGVSNNPAGRPKGIPNKRTMGKERIAAIFCKKNITPLQFMQAVLEAADLGMSYKMWAAKEAAPYIHRKQPVAVEMTQTNDPTPVQIVISFKDARKKPLTKE